MIRPKYDSQMIHQEPIQIRKPKMDPYKREKINPRNFQQFMEEDEENED
jgi:hypothetical protein